MWGLWLFSLQGKTVPFGLSETSELRFVSSLIVAVCIPFVFLIGLKLLHGADRRPLGFGTCLSAMIPFTFSLILYGVGSVTFARLPTTDQSLGHGDASRIAALTERALNARSAEGRVGAAEVLYTSFGVKSVWTNADGSLERFDPSADQDKAWAEGEASVRDAQAKVDRTRGQFRRMPWMFAVYLCAFWLILLAGLGWHAYRPRSLRSLVSTDLP